MMYNGCLAPLRQSKNFQVISQQVFIEFPESSDKCKKQTRSIMPFTQSHYSSKKKQKFLKMHTSATWIFFPSKSFLFSPKDQFHLNTLQIEHVYS